MNDTPEPICPYCGAPMDPDHLWDCLERRGSLERQRDYEGMSPDDQWAISGGPIHEQY